MTDNSPAKPTPIMTGRPAADAFDERLRVPLWWWLPALGVATLLAAEVHMGYPGVRAWLPYLVLMPVAAAVLVGLSRTRVRLSAATATEPAELWVGQAHLPVQFVGEVEVITRAGKRRALGPELDPAAFLLHRAWIGPLLRVHLTDPADPTPYWVFSVRQPQRLADLLRRAG